MLRDENRLLKRRLDELLQVARDNDRLAERLHALTLELMDSRDLESYLEGLKAGLRAQFQADAVALRMFDAEGGYPGHPDFLSPETTPWSPSRISSPTSALGAGCSPPPSWKCCSARPPRVSPPAH